MPLKLFRRGPVWYVRGTVAKTHVYESAGTADRDQAATYRILREHELWERAHLGAKATVTFAEALASYVAAAAPSKSEALYLERLLKHFGPATRLREIDQGRLDAAYAAILKPDAANATKARGVLSPLSAVLNHAARRGWCDRPTSTDAAGDSSI